jgi:hypothetical protein
VTKPKPIADPATTKPSGGPQSFNQAAECLKTLAHPVRLRMVQLLLSGRYTVGELAEDCGVPDNVASEHLRLMQRCGFFHESTGRPKSLLPSGRTTPATNHELH